MSTVFFTLSTYSASFGKKGYKAKQQSESWPSGGDYGYYVFEEWPEGPMRWTAKKSLTRVTATSNLFGMRVAAQASNSSDSDGLKLIISLNKCTITYYHWQYMQLSMIKTNVNYYLFLMWKKTNVFHCHTCKLIEERIIGTNFEIYSFNSV